MNEWITHLLVFAGGLATAAAALYATYGKIRLGDQRHKETIIDRLNEENTERREANARLQQNLDDTLNHLNTLQVSLIRVAQAQVGLSEKIAETQLELKDVKKAEEECQERVRQLEHKSVTKIEQKIEETVARIATVEAKVSNGNHGHPKHVSIEALAKIRNAAIPYAGVHDHPCARIHALAKEALHRLAELGWKKEKSGEKKGEGDL